MSNKLAAETSPYLLQHAENPVEWYPWGVEALEKARKDDKPIFLSIGYSACHWCHVMAHESFEDAETAAIMNRNFINIKVDREERPDLDNLYMSAVVAMTGSGGWPMSVFLSPDGSPFYGGTYFPPVRRYNMASFKEVLLTIAHLWNEDRGRLQKSSSEIANHLLENQDNELQNDLQQDDLTEDALEHAAYNLAQTYDWKNGGWGKAPKFPQPMAIEYLLLRGFRGDSLATKMSIHAFREMAKGGMYDVIGGGFSRYSTDNFWLVPHFEKMLYDNAQLAQVYLQGFLVSGIDDFRQVCEETLDFIVRELRDQSLGGFFSSLDADSEGEEGKYYIWSYKEIQAILSAAQPSQSEREFEWPDLFIRAYGITEMGNFEGRTVLQQAQDDLALAEYFGLSVAKVREHLHEMRLRLLEERNKRIRPQLDDKILVAWNAMALSAFSDAARYLNRDDYLDVARQNADFLLKHLYLDRRLFRSWRKGMARHNAYLEDHAALILGLLSLYQSDPDVRWYSSAVQLAQDILSHFRDPKGDFFDTRDDHEHLLLRPKNLQDNATPSGNALAAIALLQMATYEGNTEWRKLAEKMLQARQGLAARYPTAFAKWLCAIDYAMTPIQELILLGNASHPEMQAFRQLIWSEFRPYTLVAQAESSSELAAPPLLRDRPQLDGAPIAYLCKNFTCLKPVTTAEELKNQLKNPDGAGF